jgi:2-iminobutanoate/2-iminopropanoate deaminase
MYSLTRSARAGPAAHRACDAPGLRCAEPAMRHAPDRLGSGSVSEQREIVDAAGAPAAIGPYSHAVRHGQLLFCSGQIPVDPASGELVGDDAAEQARRCMQNLEAVCEAAGTSLARALRTTIYMTDLSAFAAVNEVYGSFFAAEPPARVTVGVAALPKGAYVEIDAIVSL